MAILDKSKRLKKELTLFNVYALATGATLSSGFFLLPGLAAAQAGPAVILSYLIAAIHLIPGVFSMAELSTAMPRAGGIYFFLDRSMGPYWGTIGGFGTWFALTLKTAFALIGIGAYVSLFFPTIQIVPLAATFAIIFAILNLFGAKKSGVFQIYLVIGLLIILSGFLGHGLFRINSTHFIGFLDKGFGSIYGTAGLVYISYVGITKIASISEEVKNPERNLPLAMFLALGTAIIIYGIGTYVMVGVLPKEKFYRDLTPVSHAAELLIGHKGSILMTVAAILAFFSVANAAILSASRYPLAMSRDHLLPNFFRRLSRHKTPRNGIYITLVMILVCIFFLNPIKIAKLASAFQLLLFALSCLAVIIMRESRIDSYDPGYRSPFYPWMHILGIIAPLVLITEMGWLSILFSVGLIGLATLWYFYYAKNKVVRGGAIYHIFARLGKQRFEGLDRELRGILIEKGVREQDPYDAVIASAELIDIKNETNFSEVVEMAVEQFSKKFPGKSKLLVDGFMQGTRVGATPVSHGVALPHMRVTEIDHPEMVMVRTQKGVVVEINEEFLGEDALRAPVHAFFFLLSPEENPGQHLRILAQLAGHVDDERFMRHWLAAQNEQEMKEVLLRDDRFLSLILGTENKTASLIGKAIYDLHLPEGSLIALIHRAGNMIIPGGQTVLQEGDRLTIIGYPEGIERLYQEFYDDSGNK